MVYPGGQRHDLRLFFIAVFPLTTPATATPTTPASSATPATATPTTPASNIARTRTLAGLLFVSSYCLENAGLATAQ